MWVSRSSRERSTTPHSWTSRYRLMRPPIGGDTNNVLVHSESRAGRDVPNASCGGCTAGVCYSKVTTQLERSEKLWQISFGFARRGGRGFLGARVADCLLRKGPFASSFYLWHRTTWKSSRLVYSVKRVRLADLEYDIIDSLIFDRLEEHEFVLAHLHVVPGVREEVVHHRGV